MEKKKDLEIVAAGHTCLDLIPALRPEPHFLPIARNQKTAVVGGGDVAD